VLAQSKTLSGSPSGAPDQQQQPLLLDLAEQVQALKLQSQAPAREVLFRAAGDVDAAVARNANAMLGADVIDPEVAF